jgi:thiol:disulfide interchange protein DsbD
MGGFGFALALPFALFAAFPGWLNSLPKSGGWLNTVKVVLGFIELALAIKFLSNADLVEHWGLVKIEVFLILWIIIGIGLALYLFGKIMFPHDSHIAKLPFSRIALGTLAVAFIIYLASGFRYNDETKTFTSLTLLSGLAPPAGYSWMHPNHCPLNLACFHDYEEGLAYAKQVGKPIMIDFTGWACVNCRKMEEQVWKKPEILKFLQEEYILISLYVDDRQELPEEEQGSYTSKDGRTKRIRTVGDKWATLQTETFINNSQPYYVLISENEELLSSPVGYTPDVNEYKGYLQCGLDAHQNLK